MSHDGVAASLCASIDFRRSSVNTRKIIDKNTLILNGSLSCANCLCKAKNVTRLHRTTLEVTLEVRAK